MMFAKMRSKVGDLSPDITLEDGRMAEPMENPVIVSSVQFVALNLACPSCGAPVALLGRLELTLGPQPSLPCCVCQACGGAAHLALQSASGLGSAAPLPR